MENMEKELEEREIKELELTNENENREFYVYVHIRLDNNTVFYVGKGKGKRAYKPKRNKFYNNVRKSCGCRVEIIKDKLTESQAFRLENKMIEYYVHTLGYGINIDGYKDFSNETYLTNCSWGGEGPSGYKFSEEQKQNLSESHKGKKLTEETKQKMKGRIPWNKGKKGIYHNSEEQNKKISEAGKGRKYSEESRQKISEKLKGENNPMAKKVICITTGKIFNTIKEAKKYYKCNNISACCRKKIQSAGKLNGKPLKWKYLENYDYNDFKSILINPIAE